MKKVLSSVVLWTIAALGPVVLANPFYASAKSIRNDHVNIRSGPSLRSKILFQAPLGYPIKIERKRGDWIEFRDWENNTGWVYKRFVSNIDTAVVLVMKANLRTAPSIRSKVIGEAEQGEIYKIIAKHGNWVSLAYYHSGDPVGWIRSDLVFGD